MKKRLLFFAVLALVAIVVIWRLALPNRGPLHKGKPIGYWVDCACEHGSDYEEEIKAIGAPAVPYLIEKLTMKDNPIRDAVSSLHRMLPAWLQERVPDVSRSDMVRWRAAWALSWLGPKAKPAVPDLAKQISDPSRATMSMALALRAIGSEAKDAIPALHAAMTLTNQTPHFRVDVAWAIWSITKDTNLVLKVCTNALVTNQGDIRATWVLSDLGPAAIETAPLLLQVLQDTNRSERLRSTAAWALGSIKPNTREIFDTLATGTDDEMPLVRIYSAAILWKMDKHYVSNAVPKIVEGILAMGKDHYQEGREDFVQFVENCEFDVVACVPSLTELLKSESPAIRQAASNALEKIETKLNAGKVAK